MLIAYAITAWAQGSESRSRWTRIGVAFKNKDGSLTIKLDALPVSGIIQVRKEQEKTANDDALP
jgi:hypothetical protein